MGTVVVHLRQICNAFVCQFHVIGNFINLEYTQLKSSRHILWLCVLQFCQPGILPLDRHRILDSGPGRRMSCLESPWKANYDKELKLCSSPFIGFKDTLQATNVTIRVSSGRSSWRYDAPLLVPSSLLNFHSAPSHSVTLQIHQALMPLVYTCQSALMSLGLFNAIFHLEVRIVPASLAWNCPHCVPLQLLTIRPQHHNQTHSCNRVLVNLLSPPAFERLVLTYSEIYRWQPRSPCMFEVQRPAGWDRGPAFTLYQPAHSEFTPQRSASTVLCQLCSGI